MRHKARPSRAELRALEDEAIREVVARQEAIGVPVVTDGEFRRRHYTDAITAFVAGFATDEAGDLVPVGPLNRLGGLVEAELAFLRRLTTRPIKITLPSPSRLQRTWRPGISAASAPSRERFGERVAVLLRAEAQALVAAGATYVQLDAPTYAVAADTTTREEYRALVAIDNTVLDGIEGAVTGVHFCRGNGRDALSHPAKPYDAWAEAVFGGLRTDRLLLEYDDARSGGFAPLRFVPPGTTVVLGLVTTKRGELEREDDLRRRIEEASRFVPVERLALSPQCGFASGFRGQNMTTDEQWRKLELVVQVARRVWGEPHGPA